MQAIIQEMELGKFSSPSLIIKEKTLDTFLLLSIRGLHTLFLEDVYFHYGFHRFLKQQVYRRNKLALHFRCMPFHLFTWMENSFLTLPFLFHLGINNLDKNFTHYFTIIILCFRRGRGRNRGGGKERMTMPLATLIQGVENPFPDLTPRRSDSAFFFCLRSLDRLFFSDDFAESFR